MASINGLAIRMFHVLADGLNHAISNDDGGIGYLLTANGDHTPGMDNNQSIWFLIALRPKRECQAHEQDGEEAQPFRSALKKSIAQHQ
jgi:hypothetical protein